MFFVSFDQNQLKIKRIFTETFEEFINCVCFNKNRVTKKWNIICLFNNRVLKVFEYTLHEKEEALEFSQVPCFSYNFQSIEPGSMKHFSGLGLIITSYTGDVLIICDHTNSQAEEIEAAYTIQLKTKLQQHGKVFSITACSYSLKNNIIVFGSLSGDLVFYSPVPQEIIGVKNVSASMIFDIYVTDRENQVIVISSDNQVTFWDVNRQQCFQNIKVFDESKSVFKINITCAYFGEISQALMVCANQMKIFKPAVDDKLDFENKKLQTQHKWRNEEISKQKQLKFDLDHLVLQTGHRPREAAPKANQATNLKLREKASKSFYSQQPTPRNQWGQKWIKVDGAEQGAETGSKELGRMEKSQELNAAAAQKRAESRQRPHSFERVFYYKNMFFLESTAKEIRMHNIHNFRLKFSFMVDSLDKIQCMDIQDKILAFATEKGDVVLKNFYNDDVYQVISNYDGYPLKIDIIQFLPQKNEYHLVCGTKEGKILLLNTILLDRPKLKHRLMNGQHSKPVTCICSQDFVMATAGEDFRIIVWDLHSYYIKQQIVLPNIATVHQISNTEIELDDKFKHDYIIKMQFLKSAANMMLCMNENGDIHEINTYSGRQTSSAAHAKAHKSPPRKPARTPERMHSPIIFISDLHARPGQLAPARGALSDTLAARYVTFWRWGPPLITIATWPSCIANNSPPL